MSRARKSSNRIPHWFLGASLVLAAVFAGSMGLGQRMNAYPPGQNDLVRLARSGTVQEVRKCLASGLDPDGRGLQGSTPLLEAVRGGNLPVVRYLLAEGASVNRSGSGEHESPLGLCADFGDTRILNLLLGYRPELESRDLHGRTPLLAALDQKNLDVAKKLIVSGSSINAVDRRGESALHKAVRLGNRDLVRMILGFQGDPGLPNEMGRNPLQSIAAVKPEITISLKFLFDLLVQSFGMGQQDATPQKYQVEWEEGVSFEISRMLLSTGVPVDAVDHGGMTALALAVRNGRVDLVRLFLSRQADPNLVGLDQKSLLDEAGSFPNIFRMLQKAGAKKRAKDSEPQKTKTALNRGNQNLFLFAAIETENLRALKNLLAEGVDLKILDDRGDSPLHTAVFSGNTEMVKLLLERGADPAVKNQDGLTPLELARSRGYTEMIRSLTK